MFLFRENSDFMEKVHIFNAFNSIVDTLWMQILIINQSR